MCIPTFSVESNPHMNTVKLMVFEVLMLQENTELLLFDDSYEVSLGNNDTTEDIKLVLVGMHIINEIV